MTRPLVLALLASSALLPSGLLAQTGPALPNGGHVVAGSATIGEAQGGALQITQSSDRAIINWQGFSIGAGGQVDIVQPGATSALLNRVTGTTTSVIAGELNANGRVFLVNPNGILITKTGSVNAGGFVASTLDIADKDFMAGSDGLTVTARRASMAMIGRATGGYAGLMGGRVPDPGLIRAGLRQVTTGDGAHQGALDLTGDGFLQVAVPKGGISVAGTINAREVVLTAGTAREAARGTVNLTGTIRATGVGTSGGTVVLTGDTVNLAGATIDASGTSGTSGGGTVSIGGGPQGTGVIAHATTVTVDAASNIRADATGNGDGGRVTLWSDGTTDFAGTISAKGAGGGNGGDAEVSGHALAYAGTADLTGGTFGTLLLDPYNVTISNAANSNESGFTATGNDSVINAGTLQSALVAANVTVSTGTGGSQAGNITVAAPISWTTPTTLILNAAGTMAIDDNITVGGNNGGLALNFSTTANTSTGGLSFAPGKSVSFADGTTGQGLTINGNSYTLLHSVSQLQAINTTGLSGRYALAHDINASGTTYTSSLIAPGGTAFSGTFEGLGHVVNNLTIAATSGMNTGLFGTSSGTIRDVGVVGGSVTGSGATSSPGDNNTGALVGTNTGTVIQSFAATTVTGGSAQYNNVGGLAGSNGTFNGGGTVVLSYATGAVSNGYDAGGLVGFNLGAIAQSYATGAVSSSGQYSVAGGLAGANGAGNGGVTITQSYSTGIVTGGVYDGSFVGVNRDAISQSYSTGVAAGTGFVGQNDSGATITSSYFDTATTGKTGGGGATGLATAVFQSGTLPAGFDATVWHAGAGLYPYLANMYPGGVQSISGTAYFAPGAAAAKALVGVYTGGGLVGHGAVWSGANGYYYTIVPAATFTTSSAALGQTIQLAGAPAVSGLTYTDAPVRDANGNLSNLSITSNAVTITTAAPSVSALQGALAGTFGAATAASLTATLATTSETVTATNGGGFAVDQALSVGPGADLSLTTAGNLTLGAPVGGRNLSVTSMGAITQTGGTVSAATLTGSATGAVALTGANTVTTLGAFSTTNADFALTNGQALSVAGPVSSGSGGLSLTTTAGSLTLDGTLTSSGTVTLVGAAGIGQMAGTISAGTLTGSATTGAVALGDTNQIATLGGFTTNNAAFSLTNGQALNVVGTISTGSGPLTLANSGAITLAGSLSSGGLVTLTSNTGGITQSAGTIGAGTLTGSANGAITLNSANMLTDLGPLITTNGAISVAATGPLSITGAVTAGTNGNVMVQSGQDLTIAAGNTVTGGIVTLAATRNFINQAGANALAASSRWLVYAADPRTSTPGGLAAAFIQYAAPYGTAPAQATGDGLLYSVAPVVTASLTGTVAKTYDGTIAATLAAANYNSSGAINGDTVTVTTPTSGNYDTANVGTGKTVSASGVAIASASDGATPVYGYQLASGTASGAIGTITPATLTYVANDASRTYGAANPIFAGTVSGFVNGENQTTATTGTLAFTSPATAASNVGGYAIDGSGLTADHGNYVFQQAAGNATALTITPAPLTVGGAKTYDASTGFATGQFTVSGAQNGETVTLTAGTGTSGGANVGSYANSPLMNLAIGVSGGNASAANYALPSSGTLTISPATITVAGATGVDKTYDGTTALPGGATGFTYTGVYPADQNAVSVAAGSAAYDSANAGSRQVDVASLMLSGAAAGNYLLSSTAVTGSGTITPATLTYTANAASRSYGAANPAFSGTVSGFADGESQASATTGTLAFSSPATSADNVGRYAIDGSGLTANNGNYVFQQAAGNATALTIAPALLAVGGERVYDGTTQFPAAQLTASGAQNGETVTVTGGTGTTSSANVGSYANSPLMNLAIGVSGGNASAANYALPSSGTLIIDQRALTVSANAQARVYGDANPALTYVTGGMGLVGGDTLTGALATTATPQSSVGGYAITQGSLMASSNYALTYVGNTLTVTPRALTVTPDAVSRIYGNANPTSGGATADNLVNGDMLTSVSLASPATQTSGVGGYALSASNAVGTGLGNYAISYATLADVLTVTPRSLTVTANAQARVYGDANPPLTYMTGGMGLVNGDTLSGELGTAATPQSNVGNYALVQGSLAASTNYQLNYIGATLTVSPRPLTITADNQTRPAGEPNPPLTFVLGGRGLVNGDKLSGLLTTPADAASAPGLYAILQGSLVATPNYQLTFVPGTLLVGNSRFVPLADRAGSVERDAYSTDTTPTTEDADLSVDTNASTTLMNEDATRQANDVCPRDKPCKRPI